MALSFVIHILFVHLALPYQWQFFHNLVWENFEEEKNRAIEKEFCDYNKETANSLYLKIDFKNMHVLLGAGMCMFRI